ncbi:LysR family transcriptional regulator [Bradyrhizobium sp. LHD-71]|uniref:LysR family transcriptional regulator n=1 Tax=Bradyrhizobium sp. LHD-71 TaxID=3072141 RepID=UPI00280CF9E6|nr:LysR family transcriptional regulator [Bradyrhizobium sp. LHD-71]MDQ8729195.1 LysR family transcriptional regulator [Bradyrhizobium sp. LHD-71]
MDLLNAMRNFTTVVDAGGFSQAAIRLRISKATISQSVKNLEDHLGVRLFNRNTRHVKLTEEGIEYNERCRTMLAEIEQIQLNLMKRKAEAEGRLCVEIPYALGKSYILPHLQEFAKAYPNIETTVLLNPSSGRLIEGGIDIAVQLGTLPSSSLIARRVYRMRHIACASPGYLELAGRPKTPFDLRNHQCIGFWSPEHHRVSDWLFERDNEIIAHAPNGSLHFNSSEAAIELALQGGGVIYMPDLLVRDALRDGRLVSLLPEWSTRERPIYLVYPDKRYMPTKVRAFADFIDAIFRRMAAGEEAPEHPSQSLSPADISSELDVA